MIAEKEKLALELEVLRLRQALGPATPLTTSAAPCATGKSDTGPKKRHIDWPQDFVPGTSINPEFNSLDLPSFLAGYLAMIRTPGNTTGLRHISDYTTTCKHVNIESRPSMPRSP